MEVEAAKRVMVFDGYFLDYSWQIMEDFWRGGNWWQRENAGFRRGMGEGNLMEFLGVVCQQCKSGTFG
jgi:hypothetical protein